MKELFKQAGLNTPDFLYFIKKDWQKAKKGIIKKIELKLKYPVFVKPANLGSSVGINKVKDRNQLIKAVNEASQYDRRIIIEKAVKNCREIECAVLGNDQPKASVLGEVIPKLEFYSYEAKYIEENGAVLEIPAKLDKKLTKNIQNMAIKAFKLLDLAGMARVDFFLENNKKIYISEVNTIPGFTSISMYPKLWEASGISYSQLLDELITLAFERHQEKNKLKTSYNLKPKS
jgi:D-alanine-D-alanine ligase